MVAGPHSAGSVSTRSAAGRLASNGSGRMMRSKKRDTGRKQSFAVTVASPKHSTCCNTGSGRRSANTSPGRNNTGSRFTCATAAAVTMLVAPGPTELVQAIIRRRAWVLA